MAIFMVHLQGTVLTGLHIRRLQCVPANFLQAGYNQLRLMSLLHLKMCLVHTIRLLHVVQVSISQGT